MIFWAIGINITISRGNDITIVLALNRILALIDLNFGNALRCAYFRCLSSVMRSFTEIYVRNFEISWNFSKRVARTEDWTLWRQICYFLDVSRKVLSLIRFANDPYTLHKWLNGSRLARFRKTRKRVIRGKTQCWALFVISKSTTAAIDQCTI